MGQHRSTPSLIALILALAAAITAVVIAQAPDRGVVAEAATGQPTDRVLRVYNNNIENLVTNNADGTCTRISGPDHLTSMLVDSNGATGTTGVMAPDILIVQQVRGTGQADAYAGQVSAKFGYPAGTYRAIVVWDDPEPWGGTHACSQQDLGDLKKKQTNAIIYNSARMSLLSTSKYWSAGWLRPGTAYNSGAGCVLYKPPNADAGTTYQYKWKRTSAIAARFVLSTGVTVSVATMHLPQENRQNACAGAGDAGIGGTGIHIGADATTLMNASDIRVVGIDANRTGIPATTLGGFGMTGYGTKPTGGTSKIDYLFVRGSVQPSSIGYTVSGTKSNHKALYGFITY